MGEVLLTLFFIILTKSDSSWIPIGGNSSYTIFVIDKVQIQELANEEPSSFRLDQQVLIVTSIIRRVQFLKWLANLVVVPKPRSIWWVYVDFTSLNKAILKKPFSLELIRW